MPMNEERRVLSMWQPWASMFAKGLKMVESRGSDTKFRGEFYIHATKGINPKAYDYYVKNEDFRIYVNIFLGTSLGALLSKRDFAQAFTTGAIIGKATLVNSEPSWDLKKRWEENGYYIDWEREFVLGIHGSDRYAWECANHTTFDTPTPVKGKQSILWKAPPDLVIFD